MLGSRFYPILPLEFYPILELSWLKLRELKEPAQGYPATKWLSKGFSSGLFYSGVLILNQSTQFFLIPGETLVPVPGGAVERKSPLPSTGGGLMRPQLALWPLPCSFSWCPGTLHGMGLLALLPLGCT